LLQRRKKEVIQKSSLVIEVKPIDDTVDLDKLFAMIKEIKIEGLTWGECGKKVPLAYTLFKLQVSCTILDELVNTDDIIEQIEVLGMDEKSAKEYIKKKDAINEDDDDDDEEYENSLVSSAEIVSFNKL